MRVETTDVILVSTQLVNVARKHFYNPFAPADVAVAVVIVAALI